MTEYQLGRLHIPDSRDAAHPMMLHLNLAAPLPIFKYWPPGSVLDQGQTPQCVAYAWEGWMNGSPIRTKDGPAPSVIYNECQQIDEWAGTPHDGTSVRAGAKIMQNQGRIQEYVWATDMPSLKRWLLTKGPVVLGTNWYESMFTVYLDGYVHVAGSVVGGHAYLCTGFNSKTGRFRCRNSWGQGWGEKGSFYLHETDMVRLLREGGEACAAAEKKVV